MDTELKDLIDSFNSYKPINSQRLPDIELYMDQMISYLNKQYSNLTQKDDSKAITPSMVNNYVKENVIPKPNHKKYNDNHLSSLLMLMCLKSTFSISEIKDILNFKSEEQISDLYDKFVDMQSQAIKDINESTFSNLDIDETINADEMRTLILQLAIHSNTQAILAQRLYDLYIKDTPKQSRKNK